MILERWHSNIGKIKKLEQKHIGLKTVESLETINKEFEVATELFSKKVESYLFCRKNFSVEDQVSGYLSDEDVIETLQKVQKSFLMNVLKQR